MADEVDVFVQMWLSRWEQIRHSENQRAQTTNMILVLTGAGLGFIAQKGLKSSMLSVAIGIFALGTLGALLSIKYYERFRFHIREANALRDRLDDRFPGMDLRDLYEKAIRDQLIQYRIFARLPLFTLWFVINVGIAFAGVLLVVLILVVS